jgi:hypothetical protein
MLAGAGGVKSLLEPEQRGWVSVLPKRTVLRDTKKSSWASKAVCEPGTALRRLRQKDPSSRIAWAT